MSAAAPDAPVRPVLRVVRGDASPEELAALTAVVVAASSGGAEPARPPVRGRWNDPAALIRRAWPHGEGGWRSAR
jgi:hypothetical protein